MNFTSDMDQHSFFLFTKLVCPFYDAEKYIYSIYIYIKHVTFYFYPSLCIALGY